MAKGTRISKASQKRMAKSAAREAEELKKRIALREAERLKKKLRDTDTMVDNIVLRRTKTATRYMIIDLQQQHAGNATILDDVVVINTDITLDRKKVEKALRVDYALRTLRREHAVA